VSVAVVSEATGPEPPAAPAPADPGRSVLRRRLLVVVAASAWIGISIVLQLLRSTRTPVWDDVWAEDGRYFYGNARLRPWHSTLFQPLAGYLQVVPRGWSIIAAQFPVADAAVLISVSAALSASVLSVYVFAASRGVLPQAWQRYAVAALVAVHPAASWEVNAALNNVHWFLIIAAFWACLSEGGNRWRTGADVVVVVLSTLSDALTGLWLPIVLVRAYRGRGSSRWVASALVISLVLQYVLAVHGAHTQNYPREYRAWPEAFAFRLAGSLLVGENWNSRLFAAHGAAWALIAAVVVLALMAFALVRLRGRDRNLVAVCALWAVFFFASALVFRGGAEGFLIKPVRSIGSRYVIVSLYLGYVAWIVSAGGLGARLGRWWAARSATATAVPPSTPIKPRHGVAVRRRPAAVGARAGLAVPVLVCLLIGVHLADNYATLGARTHGESWRTAVASAKVACARGQVGKRVPSSLPRFTQPYLKSPGVVWIPVSPWSPNWPVRLPCSQL
jgi:hypothetical protein